MPITEAETDVIDFQPFFTLVEDTVTREHFHPTVHYIFADDESDIITEAVCRSLEQRDDDDDAVVIGGGGGGGAGESRYLPPPAAGVREHYVVLDVQPVSVMHRLSLDTTEGTRATTAATVAAGSATTTTYKVVHAQSLSSEWQVLKTSIGSAPTIGGQDGDEALMLRIDGRGYAPADEAPPHTARAGDREQESVEDLIARFQKGLDDIRTVMLAGRGPDLRGEDES
ncbi:hypothetical protein DV735_g4941, partial [Chaetothyriales sp. CBS 134920]